MPRHPDNSGSTLPFIILLALNAAICAFWIYYRIAIDVQFLPYPHFLVDYDFGLIRRGLVGAVTALFLPQVSLTTVFLFGIITNLIAVLLYLVLFRRDFGLRRQTLPLLVLVAGSPFFFKNFFYNLGYFDVLGCIVAIIALLLPAGALSCLIVALACIALLFVHHLHMLLYVPAIFFILAARYLAGEPHLHRLRLAWLSLLLLAVTAAFLLLLAQGNPSVTPAEFLAHMQARALDPFHENFAGNWFRTPAMEWRDTMQELPDNLLQAPLYILVLALHWPLLRLARDSLASLAPRERLFAACGLGAVTAAYLVICIMVFDYSRWVSSWLICLWLALHAIRGLPSAGAPALTEPGNTRFAWLVTLVPRIGTVTPF